MTRPLSFTDGPIITIYILHSFISACEFIHFGNLYAAFFLIAYFGSLRISNLAPHAYVKIVQVVKVCPSCIMPSLWP